MKQILTLCAAVGVLILGCVEGWAQNDPSCTSPSIYTQPLGRTNIQGSTVLFSVRAAGDPTLTYQWRTNGVNLSNGAHISGATSNDLTVNNLMPSDEANYSVVVANGCPGAVTSSAVVLKIVVPLLITEQPQSQTVAQGSNATFTVSASGPGTLGYQWRFNGTNISGATSTNYTLTNCQQTNAGYYSVVVTNATASASSVNALLTVVGMSRIIVDGSYPEIARTNSICTNTTLVLRAMPNPESALFPTNAPVWSITQPGGSSLTVPSVGTVTTSLTPLIAGTYTITASSGTSTTNFVITVVDGGDANYNGISDCQELNFAPASWQTQLGNWRFDTSDWIGLEGQLPVSYTNLQLKAGFSIGALEVSSNLGPARIVYSEINPNTSVANINLREGSIRFWFRPSWNSGTGAGPKQPEPRLIETGTKGTTNGSWGLYLNTDGTILRFCTQTNSTLATNLSATISWTSNVWHHITLTYSSTNTSLYIDGALATSGAGVTNWPSSSVRATNGFRIGSDVNGTNWAQGRFDNLGTFNYVIPPAYVTNYFQTHSTSPAGRTNVCPLAPIALDFSFAQSLIYGQLIQTTNGSDNGNFIWLDWSGIDSDNNGLEARLLNFDSVTNYINQEAGGSNILYIDGLVAGNTGAHGGLGSILNLYTNAVNAAHPTLIRVILYSDRPTGQGHDYDYRIAAFADIQLISHQLTGGNRSIKFIYRGAQSCNAYTPNHPPTCQIVNLSSNQVFTASDTNAVATVPITVTASDPEDGVRHVKYYSSATTNSLGTLLYYHAITNANTNLFTYVWTNALHGVNYLSAVATDELGAMATSSVPVIVNWHPTVNAGANQTLIWTEGSSSIVVNLTGTTSDDGLPSGLLTNAWSVASSNGPVTFGSTSNPITTATMTTNGVYVLRLTASDGVSGGSNQCTITIQRRPLISMTSPPTTARFNSGETISLQASAWDFDGSITNIEFYNVRSGATNDLGAASALGSIGITNYRSFAWTTALIGTNAVYAIATDNNGLCATSSPNVSLIVNASTTNVAPSVSITSPTNNQMFLLSPTNILISASAVDIDGSITNVEFYSGSTKLGQATTLPYQFLWTNVVSGTNVLKARAFDNLGASNTSDVITNIFNAPPTVTIVTPATNTSVYEVASVLLSAHALDSDGTIANVVFLSGTNLIGNGTLVGTNYTYTWTGRTNHLYPITAVATDNRGGMAVSPIRVFKVIPTDTLPTVSITFPTNHMTFAAGADITITAGVTNGSGSVTNVEFYVDDRLLGTDSDEPYSIRECCWKKGEYVLRAKALSDSGLYGESTPVIITITDSAPTTANGQWDTSYAFTSAYRGNIRALAKDANGMFYAGGCGNDFNSGRGPIARFDGIDWEDLGLMNADSSVQAIKEIAGELWVGGEFDFVYGDNHKIATWDGTSWLAKGNELNGAVSAIANIGSEIYVGGSFTQAGDDTNVQYIAKLVGTNWVTVGNGLSLVEGVGVRAIASIGNDLYIGGDFTSAGGSTNIQYIAKLVGTNWVALGAGVDNYVRTLATCGSELFVGGDFTTAGLYTNANCVAKWDQSEWTTLGSGVYGPSTNEPSDVSSGCEKVPHRFVQTISLHGYDVFVGGRFRTVRNGTNEITANHIAEARWNPSIQSWTWSSLQGGVSNLSTSSEGDHIMSSFIVDSPNTNGFELFIGGAFDAIGGKPSLRVGRWAVGLTNNLDTNSPTVTIISPTNGTVFFAPGSITLEAIATAIPDEYISSVDFYVDGVLLGQGSGDPSTYDWVDPTPGIHVITALAEDSYQGPPRKTLSKEVYIRIRGDSNVIANDDVVTFSMNSGYNTINVLTNDTAAGTNRLTIVDVFSLMGHGGTASISPNGTNLIYRPYPNTFGDYFFGYTISDGTHFDSAYVSVNIRSKPVVDIINPVTGDQFSISSSVLVTGTSSDWDAVVTNVSLYVNGIKFSQTTNPTFSFTWTTNVAAYYSMVAVATDSTGLTNSSLPVTVSLTNGSTSLNLPIAVISNLVTTVSNLGAIVITNYPVIRDGMFNLIGRASDPDNLVYYQVVLHLPDSEDDFANVTPTPRNSYGFHDGGDTAGALGALDLTFAPNGIYDLELRVQGGGRQASASVRVKLDSQLKIGQFSFSEQDLVIPVSGLPLTVTRSYNSMNTRSGAFGQSWTYALNDMDVQLDDERDYIPVGGNTFNFAEEEEDENGLAQSVSIRVGGGRDVTLTLPDGRRTTFTFAPRKGDFNYYGEWKAPTGVNATLTPMGSEIIDFFPSPAHWRAAGENSTFENYDVPGWVLQTQDGTRFNITRGSGNQVVYQDPDNPYGFPLQTKAYGAPKLTSIEQRSGDTVVIGQNSIYHQNSNGVTRAAYFERDTQDRITAIHDPISGSDGLASVKYSYDPGTGNLVQVKRLTDRAAGSYVATTYHYDNPSFPHFITSIEDPRGISIAKNYYNDDGKLIAIEDADGKRTEFIHNTTNRVELVIDRLGRTNAFAYDLHGNVTDTTNALGQITKMGYDSFDNKTNDIVYLSGSAYATNRYEYVSTNLLEKTFDALGNSNVLTYNAYAQVQTMRDALGYPSTNYYDSITGNLTGTSDAQGNLSTNFYNGINQLTVSRNAVGTYSFNYYDGVGNLTGTEMAAADGVTLLSSSSFGYDLNGNRTSQMVWRRVNGTWTGATNTYIYDALNRVVHTIDSDGLTNSVVYNAMGKQEATIDKLGRTNRYEYDFQGRLFRTIYTDGNTNAFSQFDSEGRRTNSVDRAGRSTISEYDAVGRLTNTIYADTNHTTTVYDDLGRVKWTIDARGITNAPGYDVLGRRVSMTNALGTSEQIVNRFGYDANGNQPYVTNVLGAVTTNIFDSLNRVTQVQLPDGTKMFTGFDAVGRRVAETNQDNIVSRFGYDGVGRLTAVTNAFGTAEQTVTRYEYDEAGNQLRQIDALNRTNQYAYDDMGRRISHTMPDTSLVERFSYTEMGNVRYHTNFNGVIITNQYDLLNRLTNRVSGSYQVQYSYTTNGQRQTMIDASGTTTYTYDNRDRLRTNATPQGTVFYAYNANGSVTNIWSSTTSGVNLRYGYDSLSRITNVLANGNAAADYSFDAVGNLQKISYGNGVTNRYQYDSLNRLTNLTWKLSGAARGDFSYLLGLTGNRTNLLETVDVISRTNTWKFDSLYRLTNEISRATSDSGTNVYAYDAVGNRLTRNVTGFAALTNQTFNFDNNDRLDNDSNTNTTSAWFDANGNTTNYGGAYQYDVENRLTNANSGAVQIFYNGDGHRVKKITASSTTLYLVDSRNPSGYAQVLEELTVSGGTTNLSKIYNYGLDLISQKDSGGTVYYFGYDGHGSTRFLLNGSGNVSQTFAYDAYGTMIASNAAPATVYLYAGEQFDSNLGFYYLRARYLNQNVGRFQTSDSYDGYNEDPLSLHKYLYCGANPVNHIDPSGTDFISTLSTAYISVQLAALNFVAVNGAFAEAVTVVTALSIYQSSQLLYTGIDPETGERATALATAFAVADFLPAGKLITKPLRGATAEVYRKSARIVWDSLSTIKRSSADVHHRIPLEWSHLYPELNPNRSSNLKWIPRTIHQGADGVSAAWTRFRNSLGGRSPTAQEVLDKAAEIDSRFGKDMIGLE